MVWTQRDNVVELMLVILAFFSLLNFIVARIGKWVERRLAVPGMGYDGMTAQHPAGRRALRNIGIVALPAAILPGASRICRSVANSCSGCPTSHPASR